MVYGDILFAENFIIGGALLYITMGIFRVDVRFGKGKLKLTAGSIMCGAFSLTVFLSMHGMLRMLMEAAFAFAVNFVVFGRAKLWQKAAVFMLVTYAMGGVTMGLLLVTGNPGMYTAVGIYTGDMKAGMLAFFTALSVFTAKLIVKTFLKERFYREHVFDVKISLCGSVFETRGFLDTGNRLHDPVSGKCVAVAQESLWKRFESENLILPERMGVVPYEAIGANGLLVTLRTDWIEVGERKLDRCVVARGDECFDLKINDGEASECELLLSKEMTDERR